MSVLWKIFRACSRNKLFTFFDELMSEVSAKIISASTNEYHRRKLPKTLKIDEFALFRNLNFALLRHPVDESQKYFRGGSPLIEAVLLDHF